MPAFSIQLANNIEQQTNKKVQQTQLATHEFLAITTVHTFQMEPRAFTIRGCMVKKTVVIFPLSPSFFIQRPTKLNSSNGLPVAGHGSRWVSKHLHVMKKSAVK
jgi:hypothetical protein